MEHDQQRGGLVALGNEEHTVALSAQAERSKLARRRITGPATGSSGRRERQPFRGGRGARRGQRGQQCAAGHPQQVPSGRGP